MNSHDLPHAFREPQICIRSSHMDECARQWSLLSPPLTPSLSLSSSPDPQFQSLSLDIDTEMFSSAIATDSSLNNVDHISSLELSFCSYFECCNTQLPNFHALVDHYEDVHVAGLYRSGKPIFPIKMKGEALTDPQASMSAPPPSPTSSCSSSSSSAPSSPESTMLPLPPLPPSDPQPSYPNSYSNSLAHPHSKFAYTPFNPAISVDPIKVYPELADHSFSYQYDYDFGYECYSQGSPTRILMEETELPSNLRKRSTKDREQDRDRVPEKTQESPTLVAATRGGAVSRGIGRGFGSRGGGVTRADSLSSSEDSMSSPIIVSRGSTKVKLRTASSGNGYGRKREKAFRCPNAGCTKAYLNPNGLKYHLEKGTCKIEVTDDISIDILSSPSHSSVNTRGTPTSPTTVVTNIIRALSIPNVSSTPSGLNSRAQGQGDGGFRNAAPDHALSGSCSAGYFGDGGRQVQAVPPAPQLQASTQAQSQPQPDLQPQPHYHQPPQQNDMSMLATTSDAQVLMGQVIL